MIEGTLLNIYELICFGTGILCGAICVALIHIAVAYYIGKGLWSLLLKVCGK